MLHALPHAARGSAKAGHAQEQGQVNFQRASVTLDAGVSIYSHRVDSMHTDAFRVLGGLSRGGPQPAAASAGVPQRAGGSCVLGCT